MQYHPRILIYIGGYGRSFSTLVERLISSSIDDALACGELHKINSKTTSTVENSFWYNLLSFLKENSKCSEFSISDPLTFVKSLAIYFKQPSDLRPPSILIDNSKSTLLTSFRPLIWLFQLRPIKMLYILPIRQPEYVYESLLNAYKRKVCKSRLFPLDRLIIILKMYLSWLSTNILSLMYLLLLDGLLFTRDDLADPNLWLNKLASRIKDNNINDLKANSYSLNYGRFGPPCTGNRMRAEASININEDNDSISSLFAWEKHLLFPLIYCYIVITFIASKKK